MNASFTLSFPKDPSLAAAPVAQIKVTCEVDLGFDWDNRAPYVDKVTPEWVSVFVLGCPVGEMAPEDLLVQLRQEVETACKNQSMESFGIDWDDALEELSEFKEVRRRE